MRGVSSQEERGVPTSWSSVAPTGPEQHPHAPSASGQGGGALGDAGRARTAVKRMGLLDDTRSEQPADQAQQQQQQQQQQHLSGWAPREHSASERELRSHRECVHASSFVVGGVGASAAAAAPVVGAAAAGCYGGDRGEVHERSSEHAQADALRAAHAAAGAGPHTAPLLPCNASLLSLASLGNLMRAAGRAGGAAAGTTGSHHSRRTSVGGEPPHSSHVLGLNLLDGLSVVSHNEYASGGGHCDEPPASSRSVRTGTGTSRPFGPSRAESALDKSSVWRTGMPPWASDPRLEAAAYSWEEELRGMLSNPHLMGEALCISPPPKVMIRCFVKRVRNFFGSSVFQMHLDRGGLFLLAARKTKKSATSTYLISREASAMALGLGVGVRACAGGGAVSGPVAKLRANFVGTEYILTGNGSGVLRPPTGGGGGGGGEGGHRGDSADAHGGGGGREHGAGDRKHDGGSGGRDELCINFKPHGLRLSSGGPISMNVAVPVPECAWSPSDPDGSDGLSNLLDLASTGTPKYGYPLPKYPLAGQVCLLASRRPEWDDSAGGFALDFQGRVKEFSVKNFQLVSWDHDTGERGSETLLQFGKAGEDLFILDFAYPLSIKTAFAVALANVDTKLCYMLG
ncbi:hypothetical protein FOA52_009626 [Chlamydomonas sp. UWO 241]|nr:hypothetical protein FOA52_009626 [Chlamydomonas sp. UWO 241]